MWEVFVVWLFFVVIAGVICAACYGVFIITCFIVGENAGTIIASPFILICAIAGVVCLILLFPIVILWVAYKKNIICKEF